MDNLVSVYMVSFKDGELIPCIKVLRGVQLAARQNNAQFTIEMTFKYPSGGEQVTLSTIKVPIKDTKGVEGPPPDSMWCNVMAPAIPLPKRPDHGARFICTAALTITPVSGVVTPSSELDTQVVEMRYGLGW